MNIEETISNMEAKESRDLIMKKFEQFNEIIDRNM